jgi:hypothetical protein
MLEFFKEICGGCNELELFLLHELKEWFLGKQNGSATRYMHPLRRKHSLTDHQ